ncbi:hypothetical protein GGR56DRAFT_80454 [Xylariaceae sp. FL0804]|nr:hypothetical protein GGR56DRAFT_80454 [Xylariaceae sp. FL0804]
MEGRKAPTRSAFGVFSDRYNRLSCSGKEVYVPEEAIVVEQLPPVYIELKTAVKTEPYSEPRSFLEPTTPAVEISELYASPTKSRFSSRLSGMFPRGSRRYELEGNLVYPNKLEEGTHPHHIIRSPVLASSERSLGATSIRTARPWHSVSRRTWLISVMVIVVLILTLGIGVGVGVGLGRSANSKHGAPE